MSEYIDKSRVLKIIDYHICTACREKPMEERNKWGCGGCAVDKAIRAIEDETAPPLLTLKEALDKYKPENDDTAIPLTAGDRLRKALKENYITLKECGDKIGYSPGYISFIAHNRRRMTREFAEAVEKAYPMIRAVYLLGATGQGMMVSLDEGAYMPERAYPWDAGLDIRSPIGATVPRKGSVTISTGVHIAIPQGYVGLLKSKSGLNVKHGIQSEGTIDAGYTGAIAVKLYNHSLVDYRVESGDKISQLVVVPCLLCDVTQVDELPETERGTAGFGSTGR